jgi:hypothetical protein
MVGPVSVRTNQPGRGSNPWIPGAAPRRAPKSGTLVAVARSTTTSVFGEKLGPVGQPDLVFGHVVDLFSPFSVAFERQKPAQQL